MEKKNNKLLLIIIIAIIAILIVGSVIFFLISSKNSQESVVETVSLSNPESVSKNYIKAILEGDYQKALDYVYTEDNSCKSCITVEDYKNYLAKKNNFNASGKVQKVESNISRQVRYL